MPVFPLSQRHPVAEVTLITHLTSRNLMAIAFALVGHHTLAVESSFKHLNRVPSILASQSL